MRRGRVGQQAHKEQHVTQEVQKQESPATTAHWCPKGQHAWRCSHNENEVCRRGNHSEVNCPEHGGTRHHSMRPRPAVNPTRNERREWAEANLKQVVGVLVDANYQCTGDFSGPNGSYIEVWIGSGKQPVIMLQRYGDFMGFELLVPLTAEQDMAKVVEALKAATERRSS